MHDDRAISDRCVVLARISGRVQGVGYRDWTRRRAREFGLSGWVRNRGDGTVEALFAGPDAAVAAVLEACRKGPPLARVTDIVTDTAEAPDHTDFRKLPTC